LLEAEFRRDAHHDFGLTVSDGAGGRLDRKSLRRLDDGAIFLDLHYRFGPERVGAAIGSKPRSIEIGEQT